MQRLHVVTKTVGVEASGCERLVRSRYVVGHRTGDRTSCSQVQRPTVAPPRHSYHSYSTQDHLRHFKLENCPIILQNVVDFQSIYPLFSRILRTNRCGLLLHMSHVACSVCVLATTVSPAKSAEPIEMPTWVSTQVGPGTMYSVGYLLAPPSEYD